MQEIVTKVLEAEKAAEARIQEARGRAAEIRAEADAKVQTRLHEAREQAERRSQEILDKARSRAQAEYAESVRQTRDETRIFFEEHAEEIERAVQSVIALLITPEWNQG
jgi:V/A-type H+-transporting ATPase subunit G/H